MLHIFPFLVGPVYCALKVFVLYDSVNKPVSVVERPCVDEVHTKIMKGATNVTISSN